MSILKNPAMITALTGLLAVICATAENLYSRQLEAQQRQQDEEVTGEVLTAFAHLVMSRQAETESYCLTYIDAIQQALLPHQRRKVEQYLDKELADDSLPSLESVPSNSPPDSSDTIEELGRVGLKNNPNIYKVIQQRVKEKGGAVSVKELEKVLEGKGALLELRRK